MFDKILKFFYKSKDNNTKQETTIETQSLCKIAFELNMDGSANIICYWPEFNDKNKNSMPTIASEYGALLYMINNGLMQNDVVDTLSDPRNIVNEYDKSFIDKVFMRWFSYTDIASSIDSKPLIKPSLVFKNK
jgi:hypothetical protein